MANEPTLDYPTQSAVDLTLSEPVQYMYTFPPFPAVPDGVTIIPFTDYKEYGIRKSRENEFDGMGIRTVALTAQENRTKKANKVQRSNNSNMQWWEHWEEGEKQRSAGPFLKNMSDTEKLGQAASEFKMGRPWPSSATRLEYMWDQFLLFIGLTGLMSNSKINKPTTDKNEGVDEALSDEEVESAASADQETLTRRLSEKLNTFVSDPETVFKAFLSSHMWTSGLVWTDQHLDAAPRLLSFFAKFLIRNKVIATREKALNRSLDVIILALKELPLTSKLSKACPDKFSLCCAGSWSKNTNGSEAVIIDLNMENNSSPVISPASLQDLALDDQENWCLDDTNTLSQYPGATASLIDTHMPGLVEMSTRRIKSITAPSEPDATFTVTSNPRAEDIEADLNRHFVRIVLSPWANWDTKEYPEFATPQIVGGLVQEDSTAHNPLKDDIVLLAEESLLESLNVGIGIAGRWIQLTRKATRDIDSQDQVNPKSQHATYWFMDAMKLVIPSFWVPTPDSLAI